MKIRFSPRHLVPVFIGLVVLLLVLKLVLSVGGSFLRKEIQLGAPPEASAADKKDKNKSAQKEALPAGKDDTLSSQDKLARNAAPTMTETVTFLQKKEADLNKREEQIREREERIAKMEKEVEQKMKDLIAVQKEIQAFRAERDDLQTAKVRSLAKIYGTMKPKEAAKLMDNLDDRLVVGVITTMKSEEAAGILSAMDVKKAAKISEALSGR